MFVSCVLPRGIAINLTDAPMRTVARARTQHRCDRGEDSTGLTGGVLDPAQRPAFDRPTRTTRTPAPQPARAPAGIKLQDAGGSSKEASRSAVEIAVI